MKSLTLDTRGVPIPRKNQVKTISSCPLPYGGLDPDPESGPGAGSSPKPSSIENQDQMYSQITLPAERGTRTEKRGCGGPVPPYNSHFPPQEPEYSLPFDNIASNVTPKILKSSQAHNADPAADPLYDSIDEMKIRNIFTSNTAGPTYGKVEHIYDEPEGFSVAQKLPASVYDDPEEVRGDAWKIMGTTADPKGHEYPYNPRVDDYAVPKRHKRAINATQSTVDMEGDGQEEEPQQREEQEADSPYDNVMVKMM